MKFLKMMLSLFLFSFAAHASPMTPQIFNELMDSAESFYVPIALTHQVQLKLIRDWENEQSEAHARREDSTWEVYVAGGLARNPLLSLDGLSFVLCHEIGHQFGGFPFNTAPGIRWMSVEGQADYYASFVCARALWKNQVLQNREAAATVDAYAKEQCDRVWQESEQKFLCYRIANAAQNMMNYVVDTWNMGPHPQYSVPENRLVFSPQCRLDTMLQGALCAANYDVNVIPGFLHPNGINSLGAKIESENHSCSQRSGFAVGRKPTCWYSENQ